MNLKSLIEPGVRDLGFRFIIVGILPTVALFLFVLALHWGGAPANAPDLRLIVGKVDGLGGKESILLGLGILVLSLVLQPLQLSLVRMLEGYWGGSRVASILSRPFIAWHRRRRRKLEEATRIKVTLPAAAVTRKEKGGQIEAGNQQGQVGAVQTITSEEKRAQIEEAVKAVPPEEKARVGAADWKLRRFYPQTHRILPTSLGNALRAAEDVPKERYQLDAVVVWPRLYPLLPAPVTGLLADRRNQLDVAVRFCVVFLLATVASIVMLYEHGWWLSVAAATLLLAWLSYRGAVAAAVAYGEGIQVAYDLHRLDFLKAMHIPLPANLQAERQINRAVSKFLRQGDDNEFQLIQYETAEEKKVEPAPPGYPFFW